MKGIRLSIEPLLYLIIVLMLHEGLKIVNRKYVLQQGKFSNNLICNTCE